MNVNQIEMLKSHIDYCRAQIQYKDDILPVKEIPYGNRTIWRQSYLHDGISYTGKITSLYWIRALITGTSVKLEAIFVEII